MDVPHFPFSDAVMQLYAEFSLCWLHLLFCLAVSLTTFLKELHTQEQVVTQSASILETYYLQIKAQIPEWVIDSLKLRTFSHIQCNPNERLFELMNIKSFSKLIFKLFATR